MICLTQDFVIDEEAREQFGSLLPEIQQNIFFRFRHLNPELREDRTAEAVALAFEMFVRLVRKGKAELAYPGPLGNYAVRQVMDGRQCGSPLNVNDLSSWHCQKQTGVQARSLHRQDRDSDRWQEMVVEDRSAGPADVAVTRIDFRDWLQTLDNKKRHAAEILASGETTQAVANRLQLSAARISQLRRELMDAWNEFQGLLPEAS